MIETQIEPMAMASMTNCEKRTRERSLSSIWTPGLEMVIGGAVGCEFASKDVPELNPGF